MQVLLNGPSQTKASDSTPRRIKFVTHLDDLESIQSDWHRLWNMAVRKEIFTHYAWIRSFLESHGCSRSLMIATVQKGGDVCGILPLMLTGNRLHFIGTPYADYADILCDDRFDIRDLNALVESLDGIHLRWNRCVLRNLREDSTLFTITQGIQRRFPLRVRWSTGHNCPSVVASAADRRVFDEMLSKENPRRCQKKLQRLGHLSFDHIECRESITEMLDTFFEHHTLRRAVAVDMGGMFKRPEARDFFRCLVRRLDPGSVLRFGVLRLDGRPIAFHLGFEIDGRLTWYVPTFDVDWWQYRPGLVLLRQYFEYAAARGLHELDFTVGEEEYKTRFANRIAPTHDLTLYSTALVGQVARRKDGLARTSTVKTVIGPFVRLRRAIGMHRRNGSFELAPKVTRRWVRVGHTHQSCEMDGVKWEDSAFVRAAHQPSASGPMECRRVPLSEITRLWLSGERATRPSVACKRMSEGQIAVGACMQDRLVHLAWLEPSPTRDSPEDRSERNVSRQGFMRLYDFWSSRQYSDQNTAILFLRQILMEMVKTARPIYICCPFDTSAIERVVIGEGYMVDRRGRIQ